VDNGKVRDKVDVPAGWTRAVIVMPMVKGEAKLEAWMEGEERIGAKFVEVERIGD
jgi:hypothetical protein